MTLFVNLPFLGTASLLLIPTVTLAIECAASLLPRRQASASSQHRPQIAVLVPAHNEAWGIAATLGALHPQLRQGDRLIVIADNCTDETAAIARQQGAEVLERQNLNQTGKGYALDFGLQHLDANPPDIVVMIDADCIAESSSITAIAKLASKTQRPVQAVYLMEQPANPNPKDTVSALAFMVKNLVRPAGLNGLGLPCLLTGTGMAFPWAVIRKMPLASGNIVEDMQLGIDLAIAGYSPTLCYHARVMGQLPRQETAATSQRTRWEHGHLNTLITQVPRLIKAALVQRRFDILAIALDLSVPPLSLLVLLWMAATILASVSAYLGAVSWLVVSLFYGEGLLIFLSILAAWLKFGRSTILAKNLFSIPFYILWKIPLYFTFIVKPQTHWVRTEREVVSSSQASTVPEKTTIKNLG